MRMDSRTRRTASSDPVAEAPTPGCDFHLTGLRRPDVFTIHLAAPLGPEWTRWMDGLDVHNRNDGSGTITAFVPDQARLFGILLKVRDLGIPLLGLYPASSLTGRDK